MSLTIKKEQVYPPKEKRGLEHTRTEVYIGQHHLQAASGVQAASGLNTDDDARRI